MMKNAHERFGVLEYTKRMKDTTTRIRLRLDRFIGEVDNERNCKAHLISVLGGDSDIGAIWAGVVEQNIFTAKAPGIDPLTASLGEDAQCFRGTITIAGRRPIRHLVAISAELAKTRPGADPGGKRTILCDNDPTFVLYRIAQRFGLPVVLGWAAWFNEELKRRGAIKPLLSEFLPSIGMIRQSSLIQNLLENPRALKTTQTRASARLRWPSQSDSGSRRNSASTLHLSLRCPFGSRRKDQAKAGAC